MLTLIRQRINFYQTALIRQKAIAEMDFSMFDLKYCRIGISGSTFISGLAIMVRIVTIISVQRIDICPVIEVEEEI